MKKGMLFLAVLLAGIALRADPEFVSTLPADDFAGAGLKKLTPAELAHLEALVQRYKAGEVAVVTQRAEKEVAVAQKTAEQAEAKAAHAAAAAATAAQARQAAPAAPESKAKRPGWFAALVTLRRAAEKADKQDALESRLVGDFRGWSGRTIFVLEDGTRWQQQNPGESQPYSPTLHGPKVRILPAALSGFWLEIEGVNQQVRVIPVELGER